MKRETPMETTVERDPAARLKVLKEYCEKGFYLFPVSLDTKQPAIKDNLNEASIDFEQIKKWEEKFRMPNWGLSLDKSGLFAVDVDEAGLEKWDELILTNGNPETLTAQSGSGVGFHYIFKKKEGIRYRGKIQKGIDVKNRGYVLVNPSVHPRTLKPYVFITNTKPADAPSWLCLLVEKPKVEKREAKESLKAPPRFYQEIINQLKEKTFGYDEWVRFGMSLHAAFDGSDEGLELYLDLTQGVNYQEDDLEKAQEKWNGFRSNSSYGVTAGTFVHLARTLGCVIPNNSYEADLEAFKAAPLDIPETEEYKPEWELDKGRLITEDLSFLVEDFNRQGWGVLTVDSAGTVLKTYLTPDGTKNVRTLNKERFNVATAPYFFRYREKMANGTTKTKYTPASQKWVEHRKRQAYSEIVWRPDAPKEALNLWGPIPCKRVKGDVTQLIDFVHEVTGGNDAVTKYLLNHYGHIVQKPHERSSLVCVFKGEQGTGKGLMTNGLLGGILKSHHLLLSNGDMLSARFNSFLKCIIALTIDESNIAGSPRGMNTLKSLTGNNKINIEEKHGAQFTIDNLLRIFITTNENDGVRIDPSNRRFWVIEFSNKFLGTNTYDKLWNAIARDQLCEKFFDYLMELDITTHNPHHFPRQVDKFGDEIKIESLGLVGAFWYETLIENPKEIIQPLLNCTSTHYLMRRDFVLGLFNNFAPNHRLTPEKFWNQSRNMLPVLKEPKRKVRIKMDGQAVRGYDVLPFQLMQSFCERNRIAKPEKFDDLELLIEAPKDQKPIEIL